ncbi:hypothetical protein BN7_1688 [Wickerhamomyces ciferrii]|uniref:LYC1 C-terminal domain-containing protein n=1 Tax=Wickerhamomyces ciferrii (strain ATCC 14091 / BCRC 22168 / CBS 111 / JCM 3599 / NBRC 0793 / NRRL Y-1031 F-60-10) TaxID=1206466 RepID=K0KLZ1_WICCF|nr:uncharacterized protein BN7_1688 [Wickerhamomyces ciferrii]CCH42143.1 hypothetical protein BN7_1688 [Wickerhamomyces ciferrii]
MTKTNQIQLERTDDLDIYKYCSYNTSITWKGKLTSEQYVKRDVVLNSTSKILQKDSKEQKGVYLYILRDYSIPAFNKFDNIVASVETLNDESWRINGPNGELIKVISSVVGNVFTLPQHRKKGYANHLITQLNEILDEQCGKDGYSYLYSEVGDYYQKFGYNNFHIPTHYFEIGEKIETIDTNSFKYLSYYGFKDLIEIQKNHTRNKLLQRAQNLKSDESIISLIPNIDRYSWHHERDLIISSYLHQDLEIRNFGAVLNNSNDHFIWYHDWNESKLVILKTFIEFENEQGSKNFAQLLKIAIKEAHDFKLKGIVLWDSALGESQKFYDLNLELLESFNNTKLFGVNDSLSAIRFHDKTSSDKIYWNGNEKWEWF